MKLFSVPVLVACITEQSLAQALSHQYDVKFLCGKSNGRVVASGNYHTAINILNPGFDSVRVQSTISVALPGVAGMVSASRKFTLKVSQSIEIDCPEILQRTRDPSSFRKGFVILKSDRPLEVVAVYTAAGKDGMVESIHTERVAAFVTPASCPDLAVQTIDRAIINNQQVIVKAKIANIGSASTGIITEARLTYGPATGERSTRTAPVAVLMSGDGMTVSFTIPYTVANPEVYFLIEADYSNMLAECTKENNSKEFTPP